MRKKYLLYFLLFFFIIGIDSWSKKWVSIHCSTPCHLFSWLSFIVTFNRGISWSLFDSDHNTIFYFLTFLITIVIGLLSIYTFHRFKRKESILFEIVVLGGAISNLLDRLLHQAVIDFIVVHYHDFYWPLFNIADIAIVIGAMGILIRDFTATK